MGALQLNLQNWTKKHIIDSYSLNFDEVLTILDTAQNLSHILNQPIKKEPLLCGRSISNIFYENSTRTRVSFELAAKYLSADVVNLDINVSSIKKGESLIDTIGALHAMGVDAAVVRHSSSGICQQLVNHFNDKISIINAGDGCHDHPTQGLLDLFTLKSYFSDLKNKKVVIIGDILHSRVARSNIYFLTLFGADVHVIAPSILLPFDIERLGCKAHTSIEEGLMGADVVMCLRMQLERQDKELASALKDYSKLYRITEDRLFNFCKPNVLVMHPGPINRGVEIDSTVADNTNTSLITQQVTNGVIIRMALLYLCLSI